MSIIIPQIESLSGRLHEVRPVFLSNPDLLAYACGSAVIVLSVNSGETMARFSMHNSSVVTSLAYDQMYDHLISSAQDGSIVAYNPMSGDEIWRYKMGEGVSVTDIILGKHGGEKLFIVTLENRKLKDKESSSFLLYSLDISSLKSVRICAVQTAQHCLATIFLSISSGMNDDDDQIIDDDVKEKNKEIFLLVNTSRNGVCLLRISSDNRLFPLVDQIDHDKGKSVTCVTASIDGGVVAMGRANGEILLCHNAQEVVRSCLVSDATTGKGKRRKKRVSPYEDNSSNSIPALLTVLHWHASAVSCLSMSADGTSLFSGGCEAVLVLWNLKGRMERVFLPRLGAPLTHLSVSVEGRGGLRVAATTSDSCVRVLQAAGSGLDELWRGRGVCIPSSSSSSKKKDKEKGMGEKEFLQSDRSWRCGLQLQDSSSLLVSGRPGCLQQVDLHTSSLGADSEEVLVSHSHLFVSSGLFVPSVTLFRCHGELLVTVDVRRTAYDEQPIHSLKFWRKRGGVEVKSEDEEEGRKGYRLEAQMDDPHQGLKITDIAVSQTTGDVGVSQCVSASLDGGIKIWTDNSNNNNNKGGGGGGGGRDWRCSHSFRYRDCPVSSVCFSSDGSVLAVSQRNLVSVWDPQEVRVRAAVVGGGDGGSVTFLKIVERDLMPQDGGGSGEAFLILGTKLSLTVLDLLTMDVVWTTSSSTSSLSSLSEVEEEMEMDKKSRFCCFSVSSRRSQTRSSGGWIAAASKRSNGDYRIEIFDPTTSKEVVESVSVSEKPVSLLFYDGGSLVAATEGGQLLVVRDDVHVPTVTPSTLTHPGISSSSLISTGVVSRRQKHKYPSMSLPNSSSSVDTNKEVVVYTINSHPHNNNSSSNNKISSTTDVLGGSGLEFFSSFLRPSVITSSLGLKRRKEEVVSTNTQTKRRGGDLFPIYPFSSSS